MQPYPLSDSESSVARVGPPGEESEGLSAFQSFKLRYRKARCTWLIQPWRLKSWTAESDKRIAFLTTQVGALMRAVNTLVEDRRATASIEQPAASSLQEHALPATLPMAENQTGKEQPAALPVAEDSVNKEQPVANFSLEALQQMMNSIASSTYLSSSLPRRKNSRRRSPISLIFCRLAWPSTISPGL